MRVATQEDRAALLAVMAPFRNKHFPGSLDLRRIQIAEIEGEVVGVVVWKGEEVLGLHVGEPWRGRRSVGPEFLATAEQATAATGHRQVRVMIDAGANRAQKVRNLTATSNNEPSSGSRRRRTSVVWTFQRSDHCGSFRPT